MFKKLICSISFVMVLIAVSSVQAETFSVRASQDGHVSNDSQSGPTATGGGTGVHMRDYVSGTTYRKRVGYMMWDISTQKGGGRVFSNVSLSNVGHSRDGSGTVLVYGIIEELDDSFASLSFNSLTWNSVPGGVMNNPTPPLNSIEIDLSDVVGPLLNFNIPAAGVRESSAASQALANFLNADNDGIIVLLFVPSAENVGGILRSIEYSTTAGTLLEGEAVVPPGEAMEPSPDDANDVPRDVVLSWKPGEYAVEHNVYFGTDFNDVNDATTTNHPNVEVKLNQDANTYDPFGLLDFEQTYYWRIDEVNDNAWAPPGSPWKGTVWSFTVEPPVYTVENITATASPSETGKGPGNTINLTGDLHSTDTSTMWLSGSESPGQAWIKYEFNRDYKLYEMWVWNYNGEFPLTWYGIKSATILYSLTGTDSDWTTLGTYQFEQALGTADYAHGTTISFGDIAAKYVKIIANSNHSNGAFDKYGLSEVRFFYIPVQARYPSPEDDVNGVDLNEVLRWRSGREAVTHKLYIGPDEQAVTNGTFTPESIPVSGSLASYSPLSLELDRTYYWKVNEVNDNETPAIWKGDIWSFTTSDHLVVDDMESYGDANTPGPPPPAGSRMWYTWKDGVGWTIPSIVAGNGSGSIVDPNYSILHGGSQSLRLNYYNDGSTGKKYYSEISADTSHLAIGKDWTKAGVKALTLWFYGNANNDANATEQMYVKLNGVKKNYDSDMNDVREASWHEWNIDLSTFGINLSSVTSIAIGLGNETNTTTSGGSGVVYFDDIWLYPPRCLSSRAKPQFSINGDCVVDALDVQLMAGDWLDQDVAEPAWNGTLSHSDIGTITVPGSFTAGGGNVYTIQGEGADIWSTSDAFHYAYRQISGDFQMTVRVTSLAATHDNAKAGIMVRQSLDPNAANVLIASAPSASAWSNAGSTFQWRAVLNSASSSSRTLTGPSIPMCIRLVRNGNTFTSHIFLNGRWQQQGNAATVTMTDPVYVGLAVTSHVAGTLTTATFDRTCTFSGSDLRQDGLVNFKDYAVLATAWLEEVLWP